MAGINPVIPHEHGGWAMLAVPFLLGATVAGWTWLHLPLGVAWLFFYLASYAWLQSLKRKKNRRRWWGWAGSYSVIGLVAVILPLLREPTLLWLAPGLMAMGAVNAWHARRRNERTLLNDGCAIFALCLGGIGAYVLGGGGWGMGSIAVFGYSFLYFMGTVFFVKSILRERNNPRYPRFAQGVAAVTALAPLAVDQPLMVIPFLFPVVRAWVFAGRPLRPMTVGLIELAGALQFWLFASIFLRMMG